MSIRRALGSFVVAGENDVASAQIGIARRQNDFKLGLLAGAVVIR